MAGHPALVTQVKKSAPSGFAGYTNAVRILFMLCGARGPDLT
jgi:hypothetical protein